MSVHREDLSEGTGPKQLKHPLSGIDSLYVSYPTHLLEIEQASEKAWFYDLCGQRENAWRVEFQVRADRLKKAGLKAAEHLRALSSDLCGALAERPRSLRKPTADPNRSRWRLHPLRVSLRKAIAHMDQSGLVADIRPGNCLEYRYSKQLQSSYANLKSIAAIYSMVHACDAPDLKMLLDDLPGDLKHLSTRTLWSMDVSTKLEAWEMGL